MSDDAELKRLQKQIKESDIKLEERLNKLKTFKQNTHQRPHELQEKNLTKVKSFEEFKNPHLNNKIYGCCFGGYY